MHAQTSPAPMRLTTALASTVLVGSLLVNHGVGQESVAFTFDGCQGQGVWTSDGATYVTSNSLPILGSGFDITDAGFCSGSPFATVPPVLVQRGGDLGGDLRYSISGRPFEFYLLVPSFESGPVPIDLSNPTAPLFANVGLDLIFLWVLGGMDAAGLASETIPLPAIAELTGTVLQTQFIGIDPLALVPDRVSNRVQVRLHNAGSPTPSSTPELSALGQHTATTLPDGRVVLTGGTSNASALDVVATSDRIDFYDPGKEAFYPSNRIMGAPRVRHTATLLDDGDLLIVGGFDDNGDALPTAERFDPSTGTGAPVTLMPVPRAMHAATKLGDGRVLIAGGISGYDPFVGVTVSQFSPTTYLFDPATDLWSIGPLLPEAVVDGALSTLPSGNALFTGGIIAADNGFGPEPQSSASCWLFDTSSDTWLPAPALPFDSARHTQLTLANGDVVIVGGAQVTASSSTVSNRTAIFTPGQGWTQGGNLFAAREHPRLVETDSELIVGGGSVGSLYVGTLERAATNAAFWTVIGNTLLPRKGVALAAVEDGERVLITGNAGSAFNAAAEILRP